MLLLPHAPAQANDMQFFLVSPLFLFLYKKSPTLGVTAITAALFASIFATLGFSVHHQAYWVVNLINGKNGDANAVEYVR